MDCRFCPTVRAESLPIDHYSIAENIFLVVDLQVTDFIHHWMLSLFLTS